MLSKRSVGVYLLYVALGCALSVLVIVALVRYSSGTPDTWSRPTAVDLSAPSTAPQSEIVVPREASSAGFVVLKTPGSNGSVGPGRVDPMDDSAPEGMDAQIEDLLKRLASLDPNEVIAAADLLEDLARTSPYAREQLLGRLETAWQTGEITGAVELTVVLARLDDASVMDSLLGMLYALDDIGDMERLYAGWEPKLRWLRSAEGYTKLAAYIEERTGDPTAVTRLHIINSLIPALAQNRSGEQGHLPAKTVHRELVSMDSPIVETEVRDALMAVASGDRAPRFRTAAIQALSLSQNAYPEIASLLDNLREDQIPEVRVAAIKTLAYSTDPFHYDQLRNAIQDDCGEYRRAAFETFVEMYYLSQESEAAVNWWHWIPVLVSGILAEPDGRERLALVHELPNAADFRREVYSRLEPIETDPRVLAHIEQFFEIVGRE